MTQLLRFSQANFAWQGSTQVHLTPLCGPFGYSSPPAAHTTCLGSDVDRPCHREPALFQPRTSEEAVMKHPLQMLSVYGSTLSWNFSLSCRHGPGLWPWLIFCPILLPFDPDSAFSCHLGLCEWPWLLVSQLCRWCHLQMSLESEGWVVLHPPVRMLTFYTFWPTHHLLHLWPLCFTHMCGFASFVSEFPAPAQLCRNM
jgi:hypothetical protein